MSKLFFAALLLALSSAGCKSAPVPKWEGDIYTGSSADQGIVRRQATTPADKVIRVDDARFNEFMAIRWKGPRGFEGFYETYVLGCEKWKPGAKLVPLEPQIRKLYQAMEK